MMDSKYYICIAGKSGAGKETVYKRIREKLGEKYTTSIHHFSDPINEDLERWHIAKHRHNQQELSRLIRTTVWVDESGKELPLEWSEASLCRAISKRAKEDSAEVVFLDGIRRPADLEMIRALPNCTLVYVYADQRVRFDRIRKRADRPGDAEKTWEQFCKEQKANAEKDIDIVGANADFKIDNSSTLEELHEFVDVFISEYLDLAS